MSIIKFVIRNTLPNLIFTRRYHSLQIKCKCTVCFNPFSREKRAQIIPYMYNVTSNAWKACVYYIFVKCLVVNFNRMISRMIWNCHFLKLYCKSNTLYLYRNGRLHKSLLKQLLYCILMQQKIRTKLD